ncbi:MAG: adenylate/guanylate cyclase domain-containing protein, partial [Nevskiales bacterium]
MTHSPPQGRRLAAVMFSDMVGYSALTRANEAQALRLLDEHFRLVRTVVRDYRGREIKTIGDAFLISFDSALAALDCAIAVQQKHAARNRAVAPDEHFEIRIGIHLGDVEHRGSDVFGDGVNIAARVQHLAPHGGLAVTGHVHA